MSDTVKSFLFCFIIFILWSGLCFGSGYLLCNRTATKQLERANNELAEQQRKYDELIKSTDERIREFAENLRGKISDNGQTITELSELVKQIKGQRIDL